MTAELVRQLPEVALVAQTIQLAVAPVFLLAGIGAFMNVMAGRLARVVDRGRVVEERYHGAAAPDRAPYLDELRLLDRRIKLASNAILLSVASGLAVCMLVAMMFIGEMSGLEIGTSSRCCSCWRSACWPRRSPCSSSKRASPSRPCASTKSY